MTVAAYDDVLAIERVPLADRKIPSTPYDMLRAGAAIAPDTPALTFFAEASRFKEATIWSHRELFRRIIEERADREGDPRRFAAPDGEMRFRQVRQDEGDRVVALNPQATEEI